MKGSKMTEMEEESDLEDSWIEQHEKDLLVKEREKITTRFEKNNEKLVSEGKSALPKKELQDKLKAVDEMERDLKREKATGEIELKANATVDKLLAQVTKLDDRIKATKTQALDKEEGKETALGTSKLNYIDPRISAVWCKKYNVPVEKVFSKTLRDKFQWAMEIDENWVSIGGEIVPKPLMVKSITDHTSCFFFPYRNSKFLDILTTCLPRSVI
jgi:DNA topoisomerase-1